jgi:penicillin amidase
MVRLAAGKEYPRIVDPEGGHIWTANHQVVTGAALRRIGDGGYWHGARARQIRDGLRALGSADERDGPRASCRGRRSTLWCWIPAEAGACRRLPKGTGV